MKIVTSLYILAFLPLISPAQKLILSVGATNTLTIKAGTIFSADSLVLIPGPDITLSSNTVTESPVAVNLVPNPSINRVYYLSSAISFTGTVQVYYQLSELNGNPESTLQYTDSAAGAAWIEQSSSTVNTGSHYVQYSASARSFIASTATSPIIVLPLSLVSLKGSWNQENPVLEWVVDQTDEAVRFQIESCADGVSWTAAGEMDGLRGNGVHTYHFTDVDATSGSFYYRIRILEASGHSVYSYVIKLQKGDRGNDVRLLAISNGVTIRFSGELPSAIRVINVPGQVLKSDPGGRYEYTISGLIPGVYFLQYEMNGQWNVRQFVVR